MDSSLFRSWCQKLRLKAATQKLIAEIRNAPPSRRVQGRSQNVSGVYPSRKMGLTIQFESHKVELWAIYQMEHDPQVLEFYDQPPPFKIQYQNQKGRRIGHYHTPDFFVLRADGAGWEEWKTENQLQKLAEKYPSRYQRTEDGQWRCPPGEAHARPMGLSYRVRSSAELQPVFIQNLMFLEDYCGFKADIPTQIQTILLNRVRIQPGITIAAVLTWEPEVRANDIYAMIATEQLYADLNAAPLAEHWRVQLYLDRQDYYYNLNLAGARSPNNRAISALTALETNTRLLWDSRLWNLINLGESTTTLLPEVGPPIQLPSEFFLQLLGDGQISIPSCSSTAKLNAQVQQLMASASPADLSEANHRFAKVQAYLQHDKEACKEIQTRTLARWVRSFREAEVELGCGYVGLLPKKSSRGNRLPKAPEAPRILLDRFISEYFETPRQAPAISVYRAYRRECEQQTITPLSQRRFYQRLKQRRSPEQVKKRQGAKVAYEIEPWVWELNRSTPRHGDRPLAIVHIDHTQLDIELCSSATGQKLGKPWLTLLIDAYSRRILVTYLSFDAPSYRACMMALRICVSRFGRFPQAVVVDGGKEFHSIYFDTMLARYHCTKKTRPVAQPRFGSVIERLFGTTNTEFVYNLLGNTQASKQPRLLTSSVDPKRQAVWTLADLYNYLSEWAYQIYDQNEHQALSTTPRDAFAAGLVTTGEREHRHIQDNEEFIMTTLPSTRKGTALVQPGKGIKLNYLYYWSDALRHPEVERTRVPVRYDPFNLGVAYAYVQGRWVKCISQYYSVFNGHSEKELLLASHEIKQQGKRRNISLSITAKRLADFLANVHEHEALLLQRLKDLEGQQVRAALTRKSLLAPDSTEATSQVPLDEKRKISEPFIPVAVAPVDLSQLTVLEEYR